MKAFIINLNKNKDRKDFMIKQMEAINHRDFEFIEAYNGKEKTEEEIVEIYDSKKSININGQDMSRAEIGCAYSHTIVYDKIIKGNLSYALVLEDDVKMDHRLLKVIKLIENKYKENNKLDFDWLQIDYIQPGVFFWRHWYRLSLKEIKNTYNKIIDNNLTKKDNFMYVKFILIIRIIFIIIKFIYISVLSMHEGLRNYYYNTLYKVSKGKCGICIVNFYRPLYLASAYIITKEGAEKLLKINTPISLTADRLPNYARANMRAVSPLITEQQREIFDSNIVPRIINEHK